MNPSPPLNSGSTSTTKFHSDPPSSRAGWGLRFSCSSLGHLFAFRPKTGRANPPKSARDVTVWAMCPTPVSFSGVRSDAAVLFILFGLLRLMLQSIFEVQSNQLHCGGARPRAIGGFQLTLPLWSNWSHQILRGCLQFNCELQVLVERRLIPSIQNSSRHCQANPRQVT